MIVSASDFEQTDPKSVGEFMKPFVLSRICLNIGRLVDFGPT